MNLRFQKFLCVLILFLSMGGQRSVWAEETTVTASEANHLFAQGNAAYQAQDYDVAADYYRQLLRSGYESAPVLYNLGTAAARQEHYGEALGYLMRAEKLRPRDENISANLARVRQLYNQKYPSAKPDKTNATADAPFPAESIWNQITGILTAAEWILLLWAAAMLFSLGIALLILFPLPRVLTIGRILVGIGASTFLVTAVPAFSQVYNQWLIDQAIAVSNSEVHSGPAERFTRVASLKEGEVVRSLGEIVGGYRRVRLPSGLQGYVKNEALMKL